ncbi:hypothetical protein GLOTRDRAFT_122974 [Gloeophyllum trabeum ATCC 11539]|uniref:Uncharacterized protein n=1 Tax=Gloeophyllum trabeum (strain ATCC 11539 / FP-39264 / Madison 617) TaxID=670483 RepID=S7RGR6_GLOTA|nr:uncharacterized protein GLOTRDRAFT_122974 [Gloeophyllum trabeum ATCC 11539]EPQ51759.1 hypothetical protein GLOTRDRAFT_122974 [Gloeophyllum trabeum ATCC 11539]
METPRGRGRGRGRARGARGGGRGRGRGSGSTVNGPVVERTGLVVEHPIMDTTGLAIEEPTIPRTGLLIIEEPTRANGRSDTEDGSTTVIDSDFDSDAGSYENLMRRMSLRDDAAARAYFGNAPLRPAAGPPLVVKESIGGALVQDPTRDPRLSAILPGSMSFAISVHPLHIPNARAMWSTASSTSIIDWRFVRLAGLLPQMVPLRHGIDRVTLTGIMGASPMKVFGRVDVLFDALGYEFELPCWVTDIGFPVEMVLGNDWVEKFDLVYMVGGGEIRINEADARKTRAVEDKYRTR